MVRLRNVRLLMRGPNPVVSIMRLAAWDLTADSMQGRPGSGNRSGALISIYKSVVGRYSRVEYHVSHDMSNLADRVCVPIRTVGRGIPR